MVLTPLKLVCFGPPCARLPRGEAPAELRWHKHVALLVYLALSPNKSRTRDHLLGLLWAEQPERGARKALNTAINRLRHALGDARLRSEGDTLTLSDARLDVDVLRFLSLVEDTPEAAVALLHGDFLEGFHIKDAPEFEDWMARERERYHALAATTLVAAGERHVATEFAKAADLARRALALVPRCEPAIRLLMRAGALAGDLATAVGAYQDFAHRLETEVGERPGRDLSALAERIRGQRWRPAGINTTLTIPLVGREAPHRGVFELIAQVTAGSGPRALVIVSPPGMGRTRLLAECAQRLALDGAQLLQIRPVKSDHDSRWSAVRLLMGSGGGVGALRGLAGARPDALSAIAGLAPDLAERFAPREPRDVADMATALASVLGAAAEEQPVAIAIDDAHWADGTSLAALGAAMGQLRSSPVVLLLTVAQGTSDPPPELLQLESEVGREIPGLVVRLRPLEEDDLGKLVASLAPWCRGKSQRERLTRRIIHETGGSPFFAVTLLGALAQPSNFQKDMVAWPPPGGTIDAPLPFSVPAIARHAITVRIGELTPEEVRVLGAASVFGQALDLELLAEVVELSRHDVEQLLPGSERRHLIQFDGRRYTFAAPLIAEVIRAECITKGERRILERRAIDALAGRDDLESRALRVDLFSRVAPDQAGLDLALSVAQDAWKAGARRMVDRSLAAAERIQQAAQLDPELIARLRTDLL
ncbi:MAG TPA: AAA family ATPase [Gemmatimonadales bacterium]|nr:AAA family ATPase [Gemmatimonadales bacterium]